MDLFLATHNQGKRRELEKILSHKFPNLNFVYHPYRPPEETGSSFEENAQLKATAAAQSTGVPSLADDSGLIVPALKGAPGIFSARYAGEHASDALNREKLLKEMENLKGNQRNGYFECVLALAFPEGKVHFFKGFCEGFIATEEKGNQGFGYDSLFIKHDYHLTFAEISPQVKNTISHRGRALEKLFLFLERHQ